MVLHIDESIITADVIDRFWNKVEINHKDECWIWNGKKDKDKYGKFKINKKEYRANRISFFIYNHFIEDNLIIRHTCDNPSCVNPYHLLSGTIQDNTNDMLERGRANGGSSKGENNKNSKLTEEQVLEIRILYKNKTYKVYEMAKMYGVCATTISRNALGKYWKHLQEKTQ